MSLQTRAVIIAFLAGVVLVVLIQVFGGTPGQDFIPPLDTSGSGNAAGYQAGYWIGYWTVHWMVMGVIPLIFAVIAIIATAYRAGVSSSVKNGLGAVASVVGISIAVSCAQLALAATFPKKELPYADASSARDAFVKGAVSSCTKGLQAAPGAKSLSAANIDAYCSCYASAMADTITRTEVAYFAEHKAAPADMSGKIKMIAQNCMRLVQGRQ